MQIPNPNVDNPLKTNDTFVKPKPKLNKKYILITIPILLGIFSLIISTVAKPKTSTITNLQQPTPTVPTGQQSVPTQSANDSLTSQLDQINSLLQNSSEIKLPKIDEEITF